MKVTAAGAPKEETAPGGVSSRSRLVSLARIGKAHGLGGEVKIDILGRTAGALDGARYVFVGPTQLDARLMVVEGLRGRTGRPILKLRGIDGPEEARALGGSKLFLPRGEFPPPGEGEFYQVDLVGMRVDAEGENLGTVMEVVETPAFDLLVVRGSDPNSEERLVPFTRAVLKEVNPAEGVIRVQPPGAWEAAGGEPPVARRGTGKSGDGKKRRPHGRRKGSGREKPPG